MGLQKRNWKIMCLQKSSQKRLFVGGKLLNFGAAVISNYIITCYDPYDLIGILYDYTHFSIWTCKS